MSQQPYSPPIVYQQEAYPSMSTSNSSGPLSNYPALSGSDSGSFAGWMGPPPAQPAPAQQQQQQRQAPTIYGSVGPSPWGSQQQQQQPYQPYPQQQPAQQPYPYPQQQPNPYPQQQQAQQPSPYPQQQQQPVPQPSPYPQQQPAQQPYPYPQQEAMQQQPQQPPRYGQNTMQQTFSPAGAPHMMAPPPGPSAGRKKALLIGCCYPGSPQALNGCINDVQCIQYCLQHRFGFNQPGSIVVLRDDQAHPDYVSTRANILRGITWLMQDQRPGDSLFFHFSGHGSQQTDYSGDELDGQDETILPTDFKAAGMISDDELNEMLVRPLQHGVVLHALIDACHSGTALDLPYRAKYKESQFSWKLKTRVIKGTSGGTAFQIGACKDSQVAADTNAMSGGTYTGAATFSFIEAVEQYGTQQTYANLLQHMMQTLRKQQGGTGGVSALGGGMGGGGLTGMAVGLMASFLLGAGALGGQVPVICCDKQVDLYATRLCI